MHEMQLGIVLIAAKVSPRWSWVCFAAFSSQQSTGNLQHSTCCQLWMLPPTRNVRTTATTTGTSGCNNSAAQLTVIAGASCFRTTNGLINYVFDISPPPSTCSLPTPAHLAPLSLSLSLSRPLCVTPVLMMWLGQLSRLASKSNLL